MSFKKKTINSMYVLLYTVHIMFIHHLIPVMSVQSFFTVIQTDGRWTRKRHFGLPFFFFFFAEKWTAFSCVQLVVRTINMITVCPPCAASFRKPLWFCSFTACQIMRGTGASFLCCLSEYPLNGRENPTILQFPKDHLFRFSRPLIAVMRARVASRPPAKRDWLPRAALEVSLMCL